MKYDLGRIFETAYLESGGDRARATAAAMELIELAAEKGDAEAKADVRRFQALAIRTQVEAEAWRRNVAPTLEDAQAAWLQRVIEETAAEVQAQLEPDFKILREVAEAAAEWIIEDQVRQRYSAKAIRLVEAVNAWQELRTKQTAERAARASS